MADTRSDDKPVSFLQDLDPSKVADYRLQLDAFVVGREDDDDYVQTPIALVSSGGTAVDLERHTVRSLENFSTGTRGSMLVEQLLAMGYRVIFLQRTGSASPYARLLMQQIGGQPNHGMSLDQLTRLLGGLNVSDEDEEEDLVQLVLDQERDPWLSQPPDEETDEYQSKKSDKKSDNNPRLHRALVQSRRVRQTIQQARSVVQSGRLLTIPFRTIEDYLGLLELCCTSLRESMAMVILAAAVSDFYIPNDEKATHKIQSKDSSETGLTLHLHPVPKCLGLIRRLWCPQALVVSFKLETDHTILRRKSERAVTKYGCHVVVGNLLQTRHEQVWILQQPIESHAAAATSSSTSGSGSGVFKQNPSGWDMDEISKADQDPSDPDALEAALTERLVQIHFEFLSFQQHPHNEKSAQVSEFYRERRLRLLQRRRSVNRQILWKQVKQVTIQCLATGLACYLSWQISSHLSERMESVGTKRRGR